MSEPDVKALRTLPAEEQARLRRRVRVLVLSGLGLNCEVETELAFRLAGASPERVHLLDLLERGPAARLADYSILAFVGGFAFGDHLGAGFVFANKIRWRLYEPLLEFIEGGGLALGICNGFQTMVRLGMLPGIDRDYRTPRATLAPNDHAGYRDAWVRLAFEPASPCVWTRGLSQMELPARHGEGKFLAESPELLDRMAREGQLAAKYVDARGEPTTGWPDNPNGSPLGVAGVCDPSGRLFGLMPHPDAFLYPFHHPHWRRWPAAERDGEGRGLAIFRNGVDRAAVEL